MNKIRRMIREIIFEIKFEDYDPIVDEWEDVPPSDIAKSDPEEEIDNRDISVQLFDLISTAYQPIGGHFNFHSADQLPGKYNDWEALEIGDDEDDPDAVIIGQISGGNYKIAAIGHDGASKSKQASMNYVAELLEEPGNYAEVSGALAHILITRFEASFVNNKEKVERILKKGKVDWIGARPDGKYPNYNGWYSRSISGHPGVMKIILGNPNDLVPRDKRKIS